MIIVRRVISNRERRAQLAERERDLAAREAVVEERARIARELHDAIAHNVSMMVVQAGAERRVLDERTASTREVLETIEQIGRGALTEMRRLVGMLRSDARRPARAAAGARATCRRSSRSCARPACRSSCTSRASAASCPVGIELSAYRIVQEALTNALKHAGDAHATRPRPLRAPTRSSSRSPTTAGRARDAGGRAAATAWPACASGSPSTAASSTAGRARAAASPSACCCRSDDDAS